MATHQYPVTVEWTGGRDGQGKVQAIRSGACVGIAVPPEFQGTGSGSNPEELLACAVAGCYSITFGIIAANRKLALQSLAVEAIGEVEQKGASFVYTKIVIKPSIVLSSGSDEAMSALAKDIAMKTDSYCIITNTIRDKVLVEVEPIITVAS